MNNEFIIKEIIRFFEDQGFWCQIETDQTPVIKITLRKGGVEKVACYDVYGLCATSSLNALYAKIKQDMGYFAKQFEDAAFEYSHSTATIAKLAKPVENKHDGLSAKVYLIDEMHGVRFDMVQPTNVIFNGPATIVFWNDGTKTIVKCSDGDEYDPEKGLAMAYSKKLFGNKGNYCKHFKKWLPKKEKDVESVYPSLSHNDTELLKVINRLRTCVTKKGRGQQ